MQSQTQLLEYLEHAQARKARISLALTIAPVVVVVACSFYGIYKVRQIDEELVRKNAIITEKKANISSLDIILKSKVDSLAILQSAFSYFVYDTLAAKDFLAANQNNYQQKSADLNVSAGTSTLETIDKTIGAESGYWVYLGIKNGSTWPTDNFDLSSNIAVKSIIKANTEVYKRDAYPVYKNTEWKLGNVIGVVGQGESVEVMELRHTSDQYYWALVKKAGSKTSHQPTPQSAPLSTSTQSVNPQASIKPLPNINTPESTNIIQYNRPIVYKTEDKWFKEGYYILFDNIKLSDLVIFKREQRVTFSISHFENGTDRRIKTITLEIGEISEFNDDGRHYRLSLDQIGRAGKNPLTPAAFVTMRIQQ